MMLFLVEQILASYGHMHQCTHIPSTQAQQQPPSSLCVVSEFLNIKRIMNNSATTNPYKSFKVLTCNNIS
jgi:hypothetical protein